VNLAETCHFVNLLPPVDNSTNPVVLPVIDVEGYSHVTIIIQMGATHSDAGFFTLEQCNALSPSVHPDFAFQYYAEETDAGDVLDAAPTRVTAATGIDMAPGGVNNIMYVVEVETSELTSGYHHLRGNFSAAGGANLCSCLAILSGARDARPASPTVLA
jgi:hypothetical protein